MTDALNKQVEAEARRVFEQAPFIEMLGAELLELDHGICHSQLRLRDDHLQHDGVIHAGVQATLADHTAGTAAATLLQPDQRVVTAEFKVNLLRPAIGERLLVKAQVLKPGRSLVVAESEVFSVGEFITLVAKATVTLAVVQPE